MCGPSVVCCFRKCATACARQREREPTICVPAEAKSAGSNVRQRPADARLCFDTPVSTNLFLCDGTDVYRDCAAADGQIDLQLKDLTSVEFCEPQRKSLPSSPPRTTPMHQPQLPSNPHHVCLSLYLSLCTMYMHICTYIYVHSLRHTDRQIDTHAHMHLRHKRHAVRAEQGSGTSTSRVL